jgi:hypothetical protein
MVKLVAGIILLLGSLPGYMTYGKSMYFEKETANRLYNPDEDSSVIKMIVLFTVDTLGYIKDIQVINVTQAGSPLDSTVLEAYKKDAIRSISKMPLQKPKVENGKKVEEKKMIPIKFISKPVKW